jgi:hypothetical protein
MLNKNFEKLSLQKKAFVVFIVIISLVIIAKLALDTKINLNTIKFINH